MPHGQSSLTARTVEVAGFGNENTRGHGAGYQDRWAVGSGTGGAWLAIPDGIGGGPAGQEAAELAVGLAHVVLGGDLSEAGLRRLFDSVFVALRPWWIQERGGGTKLTAATISGEGILVAAVGDSPAYVDFGNGYEQVPEPKQSHQLQEWLGSDSRRQPCVELRRWTERDIRGGIVTSDGVAPEVVTALQDAGSAGRIVAALRTATPVGGDDTSATVAVISRA